ncbi:DUF5753 domain-containing protein [Streptomyces rubiginosohelvolus]|uniref:DUF5753 domain-containing protein n=1 Tax=Streptomyces rubiginosohelvolus TaxID=67362 RepID=UPI00364BB5B4
MEASARSASWNGTSVTAVHCSTGTGPFRSLAGEQPLIEEDGARFAAIIWEPALTAPMPPAKVHREQLLHILHVAQRQNVQVQVLPMAEWRAAHLSSHFVMLSFGPEPAPEAVAYDTSTSTVLVEDLAEMAAHARIFEALSAAALTPDQSLAFVWKALASIPESEKAAE